jgi:hypothetical protein
MADSRTGVKKKYKINLKHLLIVLESKKMLQISKQTNNKTKTKNFKSHHNNGGISQRHQSQLKALLITIARVICATKQGEKKNFQKSLFSHFY